MVIALPKLKPAHHARPFYVNLHINEGYRVNYSFTQCLASIFTLHNESLNIWSHLLGLICLILVSFEVILYTNEESI